MTVADLLTVFTLIGCPVVAGLVAASEKVGWLTILFVIFGIAAGFAFALCINKMAYGLLFTGDRHSKSFWSCGVVLAYVLIPVMAACSAMAITGWLTFLLIQHVF